jgi:hypothetical protein
MQHANTSGAVVPFDRDDLPAAREEYSDAIRMWCVNRSLSDALSREEIAALPKFDRVDAQRKALILNLIHYFRTHERADVAPGVAVIVHLLSDNDKGASTVSQAVMAKMFARSPSSIADAHRRLKDAEIIVTTRGRYSSTHPVIPRVVTQKSNHLAWLVTAASEAGKPSNLLEGPENCQLSGQTGELKQTSGRTRELKMLNPPVEPVSILRPDPMQIHYSNSKEVRALREGHFGKAAAAIAATFAAALPAAAAPAHTAEQIMPGAAECWQNPKAQMAAALNPMEARAQKQVWITPSGGLEIAGEFKAEMQRTFPLVDMPSALAAACPNVKPERGAMEAFQAIRRQFGYMQQDAAAREKRSASYRKPASASSDDISQYPAAVQERIRAARAAKGLA